jgi:plasmid replication initiation protein
MDDPADPMDGNQMMLALFDQQPEILRKPVQAVHMAITGGQQNKTQRLAFNAMLKHAHDTQAKNPNVVFDTYEMSRVQLMNMIDYKSPNRKHLKEALTKMQDLKVVWDILAQDGEERWASCVLLPFISMDRDKVYYSYAPQIKPMLFDPKTYARLDLRIQRTFRLDCAAALYEWVNRFRTNPSKRTNEMSWQDWRWVIYGEIQETSVLTEYKMFKREKLKPAILEINDKSDLQIELIENKDGGRSIKLLQFIVMEKPRLLAPADEDADFVASEKFLDELDVSARDRKKILSKFSAQEIEAHYQYTIDRMRDLSQKPLGKAAQYFKHALENGYAKAQVKAVPEKRQDIESVAAIQRDFAAHRNKEAEGLFKEMMFEDQNEAIDDYNSAIAQNKGAHVPSDPAKRQRRHLAPFYSWFAIKTWGEPSMQDLVEFALKSGTLMLPSAPA